MPCDTGGGVPSCLAPGTYRLTAEAWPRYVTIDVPAGWWEWQPGADFDGVLVESGPDAPGGSGWGVTFMAVGDVSKDPCRPGQGSFDRSETTAVDGLVGAMGQWPGFEASAPRAIEVDGHPGILIELSTSVAARDCLGAVLWRTPRGVVVDGYPMADPYGDSNTAQFRIVDVDGTLLAIRETDFPGTSPYELSQGVPADPDRHAADQVELRQIVDSVRLVSPPPGP